MGVRRRKKRRPPLRMQERIKRIMNLNKKPGEESTEISQEFLRQLSQFPNTWIHASNPPLESCLIFALCDDRRIEVYQYVAEDFDVLVEIVELEDLENENLRIYSKQVGEERLGWLRPGYYPMECNPSEEDPWCFTDYERRTDVWYWHPVPFVWSSKPEVVHATA